MYNTTSNMMKETEQQPTFPNGMPTAPPSYDEAVLGAMPTTFQQPQSGAYPSPPPPFMMPPAQAPPYPTQTTYPPPVMEVTQHTIIALPLGPSPSRITCPQCHSDVLTTTDTEPSCAAHLCCLLLLLIGCCPFSSLPYCMDSLKNVRHSCPNCKVYLGSYQP